MRRKAAHPRPPLVGVSLGLVQERSARADRPEPHPRGRASCVDPVPGPDAGDAIYVSRASPPVATARTSPPPPRRRRLSSLRSTRSASRGAPFRRPTWPGRRGRRSAARSAAGSVRPPARPSLSDQIFRIIN